MGELYGIQMSLNKAVKISIEYEDMSKNTSTNTE